MPATDPTAKIVVLDDDPTGSQTVHGCLLLTRWDPQTLGEALRDPSPLFFVLTNTRGMDATRAADLTRSVCRNLRLALDAEAEAGRPVRPILVSRSDSTLRGHYPVETDVIAQELGPFDAHFLVPAFFEGGRVTLDGIHYLVVDGRRVPVHETEFARDSVFGYSTAYLPDYVAEKTRGRIPAAEVERITLGELRGAPGTDLAGHLARLAGNRCAVVDAETQADLDAFTAAVLSAVAEGKRLLFRSAASLLTSLAGLPPQPIAPEAMGRYRRGDRAGAVIVGSHVAKTTAQLSALLREPGTAALEVEVDRIGPDGAGYLSEIQDSAAAAFARGLTPVIFTSRTERTFPDQATRLAFGVQVSGFLMALVRALPPDLGFLIGKGGITSNDLLSDGLALSASRVLGQVLPGCSVVRCPEDHPRYPGLPVVIFPGNVGDDGALARAYGRMAGR